MGKDPATEYNKMKREAFLNDPNEKTFSEYVMSETLSPIEDYPNVVLLLQENYEKYPNTELFMVGAEIISMFGPWHQDNFLLDVLDQNYPSRSSKEQAIICYLHALHIRMRASDYADIPAYRQWLSRSVEVSREYSVPFFFNRLWLARICEGEEARLLYHEALNNVQKILSIESINALELDELTDPSHYIEEFVLGTQMPLDSYEDYKKEAMEHGAF